MGAGDGITSHTQHVALLVQLVVEGGGSKPEHVVLEMRERRRRPTLHQLEVFCTANASGRDDAVTPLLDACELEDVRWLSVGQGTAMAWVPSLPRLQQLTRLNLAGANLAVIPKQVGE